MKMAEYTLMNKNHPVVSFKYDRDIHAVVKIVDVHDLRYAPVALADSKGIVTRRALNDWWRRRAIPASRHQIQQLLDSLNLNSTLELAEENFGLSLSDRYWINNSKNPLKWEDVNFFDNDFTDDLGMLTLGQESSGNPNLMSPNSTLGGDLNKKWKIVNGRRILVKGGTGSTRQEVLNEVVATALYKVPAKEVIPYRIYPVLSPVWKADGYDELGIIYDRYLDLLVTYVVEGESETDGYAAAIVTYDNLDTFDLPRGKLFEYASRNLKSDIRIGFTGTTGQLAMLEIGRLSGGVGGASALLLSSVWESAVKLLGTEKIIFFALSNCELMAVVAEERIIHALKSGLFDAARESVPVEEYFPKSIYGLVSDRSGYCLHRF